MNNPVEVPEAFIDLYEVLNDNLKVVNKRGRKKPHVFISRIGPCLKIHPSEKSASKYLFKMGFRYDFHEEKLKWLKVRKSDIELKIERFYKKITSKRCYEEDRRF